VTADSVPRQPTCRFTISRTPPFRLSFHLCVSRCTGACPVGSSAERGSSEWSRVPRAAGSVARVCRLTPLDNTMSSISPAPQGEVGQSHLSRLISRHTGLELVWGPRFGVSLRLQMQEEPTRGTRRFSLLLLLLRLRPNRAWSSLRRVHPMEESPAPLVVILRTNLFQFTVSTLVCHHRPLRGT
jgi:hypothetical protein